MYTDADLIAEAAHQHHKLTLDPDYVGVGQVLGDSTIASTGELWEDALIPLDGPSDSVNWDTWDKAQKRVHDLISGAADVSSWAVQLGAAGLEPHEPMGWMYTRTGWEVAVQVATSPQLSDETREQLVDEIRAAVTHTNQRLLGGRDVDDRPQETDLFELRGLATQLRAAGQRLMAATDRGPALHALEDLAYSAARQAHDAASDHAPDSDGDCTAGCVEDWPCTPLRRAADTARAALNVIHNC